MRVAYHLLIALQLESIETIASLIMRKNDFQSRILHQNKLSFKWETHNISKKFQKCFKRLANSLSKTTKKPLISPSAILKFRQTSSLL